MKSALAATFTAMLTATGSGAQPMVFQSAETPATLVELFTSEGCSSCPPADAWVSKLKGNPDLWKRVVPVVFHVDYWNGLGWPDRFATAAHTARQRRYAAAWRSNSVYTPGFAVNGREWRGYFRGEALPESSTKVGRLTLTLRDREVEVSFIGRNAGPQPVLAEVALLGVDLRSEVQRGENSGRKLQHDFTVLWHASVALGAVGQRFTATVPLPLQTGDSPSAIASWIIPGHAQPPIQATGGWLTKAGR